MQYLDKVETKKKSCKTAYAINECVLLKYYNFQVNLENKNSILVYRK